MTHCTGVQADGRSRSHVQRLFTARLGDAHALGCASPPPHGPRPALHAPWPRRKAKASWLGESNHRGANWSPPTGTCNCASAISFNTFHQVQGKVRPHACAQHLLTPQRSRALEATICCETQRPRPLRKMDPTLPASCTPIKHARVGTPRLHLNICRPRHAR